MFKHISSLLLLCIVFLASLSNLVSAGQLSKIQGNSVTTKYSGKDGSRKSSFTRPAINNDVIVSLSMAERSDDPCYLKIDYQNLTSDIKRTQIYNECFGKEKSIIPISLPSGVYTTGIRVCLNSGGDKIKGIQLTGYYEGCLIGKPVITSVSQCSDIKAKGHEYQLCSNKKSVSKVVDCEKPIRRSYERANCQGSKGSPDSDWEKEVNCPAGKVATGLKLNTRNGGGARRMYNGIALVCHDLVSN